MSNPKQPTSAAPVDLLEVARQSGLRGHLMIGPADARKLLAAFVEAWQTATSQPAGLISILLAKPGEDDALPFHFDSLEQAIEASHIAGQRGVQIKGVQRTAVLPEGDFVSAAMELDQWLAG